MRRALQGAVRTNRPQAGRQRLPPGMRRRQLDEKRIEGTLDLLRRLFFVRHLGKDREVAEPTEDDAVVGELMPVVEA